MHQTFQEAAVAHGVVTDINEAMVCFREAIGISTPRELRSLLVMLAIQGYPSICILNNNDCKMAMIDDFLYNDHSVELSISMLMTEIHERFREEDRDATKYGFPEPEGLKTETELERLKYDANFQAAQLLYLQTTVKNTEEQERLFRTITEDLKRLLIITSSTTSNSSSSNNNNSTTIPGKLYLHSRPRRFWEIHICKKIAGFRPIQEYDCKGVQQHRFVLSSL